jgi:hypothetical protein
MSAKNAAPFGIYPTHGSADAAVDALRTQGFRGASAARMGLATLTAPDQPTPTAPLAEFLVNSWPNSGFRNSRQRGAG